MNNIIAVESPAKPTIHETTCPYCGVGCGVRAEVIDNTLTTVSGLEAHPANHGRLCVKGSALHETMSAENRLLHPEVNGKKQSWDNALNFVAKKWQAIIADHGPDAVAFYLSGQLLTEDYYVANKLMKGFIGTSNIDTNSRLCMASAVVAHKRAFGADAVPACYEDLEQCEVLFLVGSNTAYAHPVLYQRIAKARKEHGIKVVVLDPRKTASCDIADVHIPLKPGSDAFFFNGLLRYLVEQHAVDADFVREHCDGFDEAVNAALSRAPTLVSVSEACDTDAERIAQAYQLFIRNDKVVTLFSQGINQSSSGVDKGNAIINCHLATGKIGKLGSAPFSITGQPNAMGGREVGGLANQFAAHMGFEKGAIELVEEFWHAPNISKKEGLKAVDMFEAIRRGDIKSIWIMATNPVVSMPEANRVKEALETCELVIVSDCMANTDTVRCANVRLPATSWGEKHGTVTNSERCISLQKGFLKAPGEARNDWEIISDFACKMGFGTSFSYRYPVEIFREHARLSGHKNNGTRAFDISGLADINDNDYENFRPRRWPITAKNMAGTDRLFTDGKFYTGNGRAKFIPIISRLPYFAPGKNEFIMNTGRIRDQWHTMTRTGKTSRLLSHTDEPYLQIHPVDASKLNVHDGGLAELTNNGAKFIGRVTCSHNQRQGEVFVPMHWNDVYSSHGRADALVNAVTDHLSGQPEFKHCPVNIQAYVTTWSGLLFSAQELKPTCEYWTKTVSGGGYAYTLADKKKPDNWQAWLQKLLKTEGLEWARLDDSDKQFTRIAAFQEGRLITALITTKSVHQLPDKMWLSEQLAKTVDQKERFMLLAGVCGGDTIPQGAIICSCFQIGENQIKATITDGCHSTQALGDILKCGTNCGSCIPELSKLIETASTEICIENTQVTCSTTSPEKTA